MDISKSKTTIVVAIAFLWLACMVLGWENYAVTGMCLGVVLMFLHMVLGAAKNNVISKKFLFYPMACWAVLWVSSFLLSKFFSDKFAGVAPTFDVMGFHPSFAPTVFLYWIGGMLSLSLGFVAYQDEWLSEKDWDNFCKKLKELKEAH